MTAIVRGAVRTDIAGMKAVISSTDLFPAELLEDMIAPALGEPSSGELWRVLEDGGVRGLAYAAPERMTEGTWNLLLIAVDAAAQGQGIGTCLIGAIEAELAGSGARLLLVETSDLPDYAPVRAFYAARGFGEEARIRDYYQTGEGKVIFRKGLVPIRG